MGFRVLIIKEFLTNKLIAFGTMLFKTVDFIEYFFQYLIQD